MPHIKKIYGNLQATKTKNEPLPNNMDIMTDAICLSLIQTISILFYSNLIYRYNTKSYITLRMIIKQ